jgi:Predicted nucleic acid-binding protein, contains PIN domain
MLLDTNALSALAAGDETLIQTIEKVPRLCVTIISLGEYSYGIAQSRHEIELARWLDAFLQRADVLYLRRETLPHYAEVRQQLKKDGTPIPANDCWIAALAKEHRLPVVSLDKHFDAVKGLRRISW